MLVSNGGMAMDKEESATVGEQAIKSVGSQEAAESGVGDTAEYMGGGDSSMAGVHDSLK